MQQDAAPPVPTHLQHRQLLRRIVRCYDSRITRAYCWARFLIINVNVLDIVRLCLRGRQRIVEVGCGFGLIGCYIAASNPRVEYLGIDRDPRRIAAARTTAERLGLANVRFECGDARDLSVQQDFDAALLIDLVHHLPVQDRVLFLERLLARVVPGGCLVVKDIVPRPAWKLFFTWALDVFMTRSLEMTYWDEAALHRAVAAGLGSTAFEWDTFPISDWLPYPHIAYLFERTDDTTPG